MQRPCLVRSPNGLGGRDPQQRSAGAFGLDEVDMEQYTY